MKKTKIKYTKIEYIRLVLTRIKENTNRMARGYALRKQMWKQINAGQRPDGYRIDWIEGGATKVIDLIKALSYDFNLQHSDDKASTLDIVDILELAIDHVKKGQY